MEARVGVGVGGGEGGGGAMAPPWLKKNSFIIFKIVLNIIWPYLFSTQ